MKQIFFIAVMFIWTSSKVSAQGISNELGQKIAGKKNLKAIMVEVENFFSEQEKKRKRAKAYFKNGDAADEEFENELLHWKRWEYYNKTRLKANGDLEDVTAKTIAAWQKVHSKYEKVLN